MLKTNLVKSTRINSECAACSRLAAPVVEIEMPVPDLVSVTEPVQTPATNAPVLVGLIVPEDTVKVLVPV